MKQGYKDLKEALEIAIKALDKRLEEEPYEGVIKDIYMRFKRAYEIVMNDSDLKYTMIHGSGRQYYDNCDDYFDPLIKVIGKVEKLADEITGYNQRMLKSKVEECRKTKGGI